MIEVFTKRDLKRATSKMNLRLEKKSASTCISKGISVEASPDSKCPICLDRFKNMAYLDLCLHKFCFRCIHEWSKNKAECPLCKQPFNSIYHSIKAENDFKTYDLRPTDSGSFGTLGGRRFRYRTTLTGDRRPSNRRTSPPPDHGVMFEGLTSSAPSQQDRGLHRMMMRLAARRRAHDEGRAVRSLREQEMIKFRRALYRRGFRVRGVRDGGRSRDTSAEFFQRNPACLHRLVPWLKRELTVLYGAHGSLVNIVQHIIMTQITRFDMEDQALHDELRPFLQARTEHFMHEFLSFARSPFNMEAYDQHAVYDCPAPSPGDGGSSDSSVIAISEDENDSVESGPQTNAAAGATLSQTPWDDETPGPSYSTEPSQVLTVSVPDSDTESSTEEEAGVSDAVPCTKATAANDEEHASSGEDDCVIIGYVKPTAERTPELVQLSSDSEESVQDEGSAVPQKPQHIRFTSEPGTPSPHSSTTQDKSAHRPRQPPHRSDKNRSSRSPDALTSPDRHQTPKSTEGKTHEREEKRRDVRDRTRERQRSRSRSRNRSSRGNRRDSRSQSREYHDRRRERESVRYGHGHGHGSLSHSYHWHSYSHYSWQRDSSKSVYTEKRSSYTSCFRSPDRWRRPCSRSRSRSRSREPHRRERRRSRTRSGSKSPSSHRRSQHERPGGKRKYKTRHLEGPPGDDRSKPNAESSADGRHKEKKRNKEKHRKKSREKSSKRSRSPSVEIVYEGKSAESSRRHHKKKKKHKKKSKRHKSRERTGKRSPTVITIDSDSDQAADNTEPACSAAGKSDTIHSAKSALGDTTDDKLLESVLQDWEQHIPPVVTDSRADDVNQQPSLIDTNQYNLSQSKHEESSVDQC
ncbi:topoisomerase I binding, arginine/serine-rich a [Chanos chanos]|uniref:E3 ubiquitin-protein ligase Topors n=1 Tax=Chanos chanos TaxID=29144 RepID=A0A6J2WII6_CHACN|nr:E3 ubiquitin-protein ligase Topors-like [Chanos chanos]